MDPSLATPLLGFLGVVVTAVCGVVIAVVTNRKEPINPNQEVLDLQKYIEDLQEENESQQRMIQMLLNQLEKK